MSRYHNDSFLAVACEAQLRHFLEELTLLTASQDFARAPWFVSPMGGARLSLFVSCDDLLSGEVPDRALVSFKWKARMLVTADDYVSTYRPWQQRRWLPPLGRGGFRTDMVIAVDLKLHVLDGPALDGCDLWNSRDAPEACYMAALGHLESTLWESGRTGVTADVHEDAVLWDSP